MGRSFFIAALCAFNVLARAQQPAPPPAPGSSMDAATPLPPARDLLLDVERNQKLSEAQRKNYTYHVHLEEQDLDNKDNTKKTSITDSESITIDGVRVDRVIAKDGKTLTPDEAKKEDARIDKQIAKAKERKQKNEDEGKDSDSRGDVLISASRILELGAFTNPHRVDLNGRSTIVFDYAGDPNAKTRNSAEGAIRNLIGTVWIDERDHVLVRGEGRFLNDFKIGGGLVLNIHKGFSFSFNTVNLNGEVWLPSTIDAQGSARFLLVDGVHGRLHLTASNYRKFHTNATILNSSGEVGPDDKPLNTPTPPPAPLPTPPAPQP